MSSNHTHRYEETPDSFDDFLAQLLADTPEFLPSSIAMLPSLPPPPPTTSVSASHHATTSHLTCQWVSTDGAAFICGAPLPSDPNHASTHFRHAHDVRGNEKVIVFCHWRDCQVPPMQRGSLIRHLLSVHLGLLRWQCEVCGRVFSRKGTGHTCSDTS